jgi:peptidoglycan hydrolase-like protein with peptidoglycan-binding domain
MRRFIVWGVQIGLAVVAPVLLYGSYPAVQEADQNTSTSADSLRPETGPAGWADMNVRAVQDKLREAGLYFGEIDGAYSSELAAALGRYQIRNGLPITGQLDEETSKALGAKPAVTTTANDRTKSSEAWRRLRTGEQRTANNARVTQSPGAEPSKVLVTSGQNDSAATKPTMQSETPPLSSPSTGSSAPNISRERLRDYVGAFVLAGLDPHVGSEMDFFGDRVQYYDQGVFGREKIRKDLQRYATRWPDRRFWLDGDISVEPQSGNRVRVTFPLRYELRNGGKHSSGKINKTLVLEPAGDDFQIVAVNERKAD